MPLDVGDTSPGSVDGRGGEVMCTLLLNVYTIFKVDKPYISRDCADVHCFVFHAHGCVHVDVRACVYLCACLSKHQNPCGHLFLRVINLIRRSLVIIKRERHLRKEENNFDRLDIANEESPWQEVR